jgi:hypothetical protein
MLYSQDSLGFSTSLPTSYRKDSEEPRKNKKNKESAVKELLSILPKADQSCQIHFIDKLTISKTNFYQRIKTLKR